MFQNTDHISSMSKSRAIFLKMQIIRKRMQHYRNYQKNDKYKIENEIIDFYQKREISINRLF